MSRRSLGTLISAQVRIARIFNTYGPRMALEDGRVVSNFVSQARTKAPARSAIAHQSLHPSDL